MLNNKSKVIAKILIILSLILTVGVPVGLFIVGLAGPWEVYQFYVFVFTPFFMEFLLIQIPCIIISFIGTVFAVEGKRAGDVKSGWVALGIVSFILALIRMAAIVTLDIWVFFGN